MYQILCHCLADGQLLSLEGDKIPSVKQELNIIKINILKYKLKLINTFLYYR